ncbi:MAG: UDP-N-acetylmuramate--L-alanine ligase [Deltaproteobacteria bacterium]|nr:UDP-N-acetylmuramate--L-alanine ligase [Deltaproteobacteria bacterium]
MKPPNPLFRTVKQIHFIGIGGIGMSGIAELLLNLGYQVSGSDLKSSSVTEHLAVSGAKIAAGHAAENLAGADVVVYSSAVLPDNPEMIAARAQNIPVIRRAEMLAELMRMKYGIAVAGAHGKTTTTSMVAVVLSSAGLDPTVVIGGRLNNIGSNAKLGQGEILAAEADESDGSFLKLSPTIAVVTNIDAEHLDHYRDLNEIKRVFVEFINKVPFYGKSVLCIDDPHVNSILPEIEKRPLTYGVSSLADLRADEIDLGEETTRFSVCYKGECLGRIVLKVPGLHNVKNALAAVGVGLQLQIPFDRISGSLAEFSGVERRFQKRGEARDIVVLDDYAHHPTEIAATLQAVKQRWPKRRILTLFQPHRYTRTRDIFDLFVSAFDISDLLLILPIYSAGEKPIPGISAEKLAEAIQRRGKVRCHFLADLDGAMSALEASARSGDVVVTLGAGDVWKTGPAFLERMKP